MIHTKTTKQFKRRKVKLRKLQKAPRKLDM